jgi:hypothetical protein
VVLEQLKKERKRLVGELRQLDQAIRALAKVSVSGRQAGVGSRPAKRALSAAARKRIAAAQRARWAKFRAAKKRNVA